VGDGNLQVNKFVVRADTTRDYFEEVLRRIEPSLRELADAPDDERLRASVVRQLQHPGIFAQWAPGHLRVVRDDRSGLFSGLLLFDVQGLQVGDHNRQHNQYYYSADTPAAGELLRGNPRLARALVDYACPRSASEADRGIVQDELREALEQARIVWDPSRQRGVQHQPPGPGTILRLRRVDGVSVGVGSRQKNVEVVDVSVSPAVVPRRRSHPKANDRETDPTPGSMPVGGVPWTL
jgi:hypothetical protein